MDRLGSVTRRYAPEILSALAAAESVVALRRPGQSPVWFAAPTVALWPCRSSADAASHRAPPRRTGCWPRRSPSSTGSSNISAYRIVQEGLTNMLKHANGSEAAISLAYGPDQLSIQVPGNGCGMTPGNGHSPGHELIGIRERVRLYDGEMTTSTPAGGGFVLRVRMPLTGQPL